MFQGGSSGRIAEEGTTKLKGADIIGKSQIKLLHMEYKFVAAGCRTDFTDGPQVALLVGRGGEWLLHPH